MTTAVAPHDNAALLRRARAGDKAACEQVVLQNNGLIWSVVRRFFGRGIEADDLYQLGCVGFLKAVAGFDDEYGTQFSTYAVPKISGEIRRFLRDDGPVKVSRSLKEQAYAVRRAREALLGRLGCEPTVSQLAAECGLTIEEVAAAELAAEPTQSLQQGSGQNEDFTLEQALGDSGIEGQLVERLALKQALASLPEREKQVIDLRYFHGLTQQKIADLLQVSQVQVSRIERKGLEALRAQMV